MELGGRSVLSSFVAAAVADDDVMRVGELSDPVVELNWQGICPTVPEHHNTEDEVLLALKKKKTIYFHKLIEILSSNNRPMGLNSHLSVL